VTPPIPTPLSAEAATAPARGSLLRRTVALGLATGLAAAGIALSTQTTAGAAVQGSLPTGTQLYKDPNSQVVRWAAANPGDSRQPVIARRIASQPQAIWFANYSPSTITNDVRTVTSAAASAGQVPVLAVYEIPNRDCGGASAGGAPDLASYDAWVRNFAAGLGSGQSIIILEPDSIALTTCLSAQQQADRYASLSRAGATIHAAAPNAKVYLDGGHSAWNSASEQANRLRNAGILTNADGLFTNVSNFNTTSNEVNFAKNVLAALGNPARLHAVIDTSRNGNGPASGGAWCDPSGRAIGTYPTTNTNDPAIDAFTVNVTVANTGSTAINGWKLGFTLPSGQTVTSAWNATVSPSSGAVTASSLAYNAQIPAGGSQSFGFQGTLSGSYAQPTGFTLNGAACN
jgi:endoglucanase